MFSAVAAVAAIAISAGLSGTSAEQADAAPDTSIRLEFTTQNMYEDLAVGLGGELSGVSIDFGDLDTDVTTPNVVVNVPDQPAGSGDLTIRRTADFSGTYVVRITGTTVGHLGDCAQGGDGTLTKVLSWGSLGTTSLRCALANRWMVTSVPTSIPTTVTDLSFMFQFAMLFNQNLNGWDTRNVTNMEGTFRGAYNFNNGGISAFTWDTRNVTTMRNMFSIASAFNADISGWDTRSLTDMAGLVSAAESFNQSLGGWNITNVVGLENIFDLTAPYAMSNENYSLTLQGWAAQNARPNLIVGLDPLKAVTCAGIAARDTLRNSPNNWVFTDVAPTLTCASPTPSPTPTVSNSPSVTSQATLATSGYDLAAIVGVAVAMALLGMVALLRARRPE